MHFGSEMISPGSRLDETQAERMYSKKQYLMIYDLDPCTFIASTTQHNCIVYCFDCFKNCFIEVIC